MESFSAPFSVTTTTTIATTASSSSNISLAQQITGHVPFPDNSGPLGLPATPSHSPLTQFRFPPPYILPYDPNMMRFPYMQTFGHPMCSYPMGQSSVWFSMQHSKPYGWSQTREEARKMKEAWSKIARDQRKQARQRSKSSALGASSISEGIVIRGQDVTSGESNVKVAVTKNRNPYVFCAPDGQRLEEILTKKLKNSDVGSLGRIVLPKREAEEKLPALRDKEGIDVIFKDVYSDLRWSLKYKYWSNNKSRMYVLENTGEFVNHYELQMGDSLTLYEDELKHLYVLTKKVQNPEVTEPSSDKERLQAQVAYNYSCMQTPNTVQGKDDEEEAYLAVLIKELNHKREEAAANSLLTLCNGGCSSTGTEHHQMGQYSLSYNINTSEGASSQVSEQATIEVAALSSKDQTAVIDQQNNFHDVYGGLDNNFEVGCNYLVFDHLKQ